MDSRAIFQLSMEDGREGVTAFGEKRTPEYAKVPPTDMPAFFDWTSEPKFE